MLKPQKNLDNSNKNITLPTHSNEKPIKVLKKVYNN